jgi:histidinol-phosphatase (PHP family)
MNSRAWKKGLNGYPFDDVLEYIIKNNGKLTVCDDSHGPNDVGLHYRELYARMKRLSINRIYYLDREGEIDSSGPVQVKSLDNCLSHSFWKQFNV